MSETEISVTEATKNLVGIVRRAVAENTCFILTEEGVPCVRLTPEGKGLCRGSDLVRVLKDAALSEEEARVWRNDLRRARETLQPPRDRWE